MYTCTRKKTNNKKKKTALGYVEKYVLCMYIGILARGAWHKKKKAAANGDERGPQQYVPKGEGASRL